MRRGISEFLPSDRLIYGLAYMLEHLTGRREEPGLVDRIKAGNARRILEREGDRGGSLRPVEEVGADFPIAEFRRKYLRTCRPVILRGLAKDWPCVRKWSPEFFCRRYGAAPITLHDNQGLVSREADQDFSTASMGAYLERLERGRAGKYLKFSQFLYGHPELMEDLDLGVLRSTQGNRTRHADYQFFMGGAGSHTPMHCGLPGNLFVEVFGKKTWLLYPSLAYPAIDPPAARLFYFHSGVDPYDLDRDAYPLFGLVDGYEVRVDAGDVFWNPPFWWHCVTNDTDSIAIAYRFNSLPLALRASRLLTVASLLATNPTIVEHALRLLFKGEKRHLTEEYSREARAGGVRA